MALTKDQKNQRVSEIKSLLDDSKLTVIANYSGISVKQIQELRKTAKGNSTAIKVVKNRLVKIALSQSEKYKDSDTSALNSQLLYAFNAEDEVAPAQALYKFQKTNPELEFVGAYNAEGEFIGADDVNVLAKLPSKQELRGQLTGVFNAPLSGFVNVLSGNLRGLLNVLNAKAQVES